MSAAAPTQPPESGEAPEKGRRLFGRLRKQKEPKEPKEPRQPKRPRQRRPRRPPSIAFYLTLFALLTGAAAVAVVYYPIPGLTAEPVIREQEPPEAAAPSDEQLERAVALAAQQAELAALQTQLSEREAAVQEKERQADQLLADLSVAEDRGATLTRTARLYVEMAPYKAAPLMAELDDETAVDILRLMTVDEAAAILSAMDPARAAQLMQIYAVPEPAQE